MPVRKIIKILEDSRRDTGLARQQATDPNFQKSVQKDRRGTLSRFATVKSALKDRERIERAKKTKRAK